MTKINDNKPKINKVIIIKRRMCMNFVNIGNWFSLFNSLYPMYKASKIKNGDRINGSSSFKLVFNKLSSL